MACDHVCTCTNTRPQRAGHTTRGKTGTRPNTVLDSPNRGANIGPAAGVVAAHAEPTASSRIEPPSSAGMQRPIGSVVEFSDVSQLSQTVIVWRLALHATTSGVGAS